MTSGTDSAPTPQFLIVGCTADELHHHNHLTAKGKETFQLVQGIDFLQFLHPGAYPPDASLDAVADVCVRFFTPPIFVITHSNCGLIEAVSALAQQPMNPPHLFAPYAKEVLMRFSKLGISSEHIASLENKAIAELLADLIAYRIAQRFEERGIAAQNDLTDGVASGEIVERIANLPHAQISATADIPNGGGIMEATPLRSAREIVCNPPFALLES